MSAARMRRPERSPSAEPLGAAWLAGHRLRFWKRGRDGSGKCTLVRTDAADDRVHGVLYRLPLEEKRALDRSEGLGLHYHEEVVEVRVGEARWSAWSYVAVPERVDDGLRPYAWYKGLVLEGARAHGLPEAYVRWLEQVAADADPDRERARRARTGVPPERLG